MHLRMVGPFLTGYGGAIERGFKGFRLQQILYVFNTKERFSKATCLGLAVEAFVDDGSVLIGAARQDITPFELQRMSDWWRVEHPKRDETHEDRMRIAAKGNAQTLETMLRSVIPSNGQGLFPPLVNLRREYADTSYRAGEPEPIERAALRRHFIWETHSMRVTADGLPRLLGDLARTYVYRPLVLVRNPTIFQRHG